MSVIMAGSPTWPRSMAAGDERPVRRRVVWPAIHAYVPGYKLHRFNYGSVVLAGRAAYVTGCVSYANWDCAGEKALETILASQTARNRLVSWRTAAG
jgi:hypothetical protein